eukprot:TRINITY_DN10969_c0_g1_i1.p1 TRINITY_DN10969_c0_g1~~TRINITY_DN10969_c0_g1_i1.p1  ORF type:complete len:139 (+),score=36.38 TRINITY_DN10969_c0_g1_i1:49-465(+)
MDGLYCEKYGTVLGAYINRDKFNDSAKLSLISILMDVKDDLFALVNSDDEVTIIFEEKHFNKINKESIQLSGVQEYFAFRLLESNNFIDESGVVKKVSTLLAEDSIPILYMTTFNNNYVLVQIEYKERAINILEPLRD